MHYIGMLAFRLPISVSYDWPTVLMSLFAAMFASGVALFVVSRKTMGVASTAAGHMESGQYAFCPDLSKGIISVLSVNANLE
jgi:two-component system sensor histidine kinase/response regulator